MAGKAESAAVDWLDRPGTIKRIIVMGGGLAAFGAAAAFNLPGLLFRSDAVLLLLMTALVSALGASGARYMFDRRRARRGLSPAGFGHVTYARGIFLLVQLGATGWLAGLSLVSWLIGLGIGMPAFQALVFVMVGSMFVAMALSAIANVAEMIGSALELTPRAARPGRGGP